MCSSQSFTFETILCLWKTHLFGDVTQRNSSNAAHQETFKRDSFGKKSEHDHYVETQWDITPEKQQKSPSFNCKCTEFGEFCVS